MLAANNVVVPFLCDIIKRKCYFGTCNEKETWSATKDPPPPLYSSIGLNFVAKNHNYDIFLKMLGVFCIFQKMTIFVWKIVIFVVIKTFSQK